MHLLVSGSFRLFICYTVVVHLIPLLQCEPLHFKVVHTNICCFICILYSLAFVPGHACFILTIYVAPLKVAQEYHSRRLTQVKVISRAVVLYLLLNHNNIESLYLSENANINVDRKIYQHGY